MIKKDLFLKIGQFDRAFIKGDFEDADLCLKVRKNGGSVGLYKTDGLFHLERQSIRLLDEGSARMALTYLNCITFNERWGKHISSDEATPPKANAAVGADRRGKRMEA
jgi:GT2 family glycosyltransferase